MTSFEDYTDDELVELQEILMDAIIQKKLEEGKIAFSGSDTKLLN